MRGKDRDKIIADKTKPIDILELIKIDFDSLENNIGSALIRQSLGFFYSDVVNSSASKIDSYLEAMPTSNLYRGWDEQVYPKFEIKKHTVF